MSLNIATILKGPADKAVTFAAEILKCGDIQTYKTKEGTSYYFLSVIADGNHNKPLLMKAVYKDQVLATEKRQMFSKRPLFMFINNVYLKNGPFILATGNSHFFRYNG